MKTEQKYNYSEASAVSIIAYVATTHDLPVSLYVYLSVSDKVHKFIFSFPTSKVVF